MLVGEKDQRQGKGKLTWISDGASYEGWWVKNKAHGRGKFNHADGDVFIGEWDNDKAQGIGSYFGANNA